MIICLKGGQISNAATTTIQKCANDGSDCSTQTATLNIGRYFASAETIGSAVVILCGAHDAQTVTDVVEIYDVEADKITVNYNGESSGLILPSARQSCCAKRWDVESTLIVTGGVTMSGGYSTNVNTLSSAPYGVQENAESGDPLVECYHLLLQTTDENFLGEYFYYGDIQDYRVWVSSAFDSLIYYQPSGFDYTWIGNLSVQQWAYYSSSGFTSDYWTVLATKTTAQHTLFFDFTCLDSQTYHKDGASSDSTILGLSRTIFIVVVVLVGMAILLLVAALVTWYYCFSSKRVNANKPIVIQSSTHGMLKHIAHAKSHSGKSHSKLDDVTTTTTTTTTTTSGSDSAELNRHTLSATSEDIVVTNSMAREEEQRPLTRRERQAVERGGIHFPGYHAASTGEERDDAEEDRSVSSVESEQVHFTDHKVFTKIKQDVANT
ncbi:hypothetical protein RFI_14878 [Reticulomyxa filosa]|uniref:Uncharacterized protein n=1 Tax=Reticulomyxa filosa TaxID=46433 RepID=X6N8F3_RETFI|nr:hypothetical protein RFI_14878 [Reticulomyxa filosa]|eukprot:ETO22321.1 hypothetical protein RFI_14878 [Reticulomyxa filosa]